MPRAQIGDEVTVSFKGTVTDIRDCDSLSECLIIRSGGSPYTHALYVGGKDRDFTVTEKPIENWPPQENDVWRGDNGYSYHVLGGKFVRRYGSSSTVTRSFETIKDGGTKLTLVYRKF